MAKQVSMGAQLKCSFGAAPSVLTVLPVNMALGGGPPAANIMDHKPMVNIPPFGMCQAPSNPAVVAALGSPVPCVPVLSAPWTPGAPTVLVGNQPALNDTSKCMCAWAGMIEISDPGQDAIEIP